MQWHHIGSRRIMEKKMETTLLTALNPSKDNWLTKKALGSGFGKDQRFRGWGFQGLGFRAFKI